MLSLGPVPLSVVLAVSSLVIALLAARLWPRPEGSSWRPANALLIDMFLLGLLGARLVFVLRHGPQYLADPWSVLRIGDGGFDPPGFLLVACAWGGWKLLRLPGLRVPVLASALLGLLAWGGLSMGLERWQARHVQLPALVLQDLQGAPIALAAAPGQPLVVNLWASWCGPCVREMPVLAKAQREHARVRFLFVNQGEEAATVRAFVQAHAPQLQGVLLDEEAATSEALGAKAYPSTLFFDGQGRLREMHLGELTAAGLEHKLRRLR